MISASRRTLTALSVAALVGFAGCGDDGDDDPAPAAPVATATTPAQPETTPAPAEQPATPAESRTLARAGLMELSDFPAGWKLGDQDDDQNKAQCPSVKGPRDAAAARANSKDFEGGPNEYSFGSNSVWVYADVAEAQRQYSILSGDETPQCLIDELVKNFDDDESQLVGTPQIANVQVAAVGEERVSARFTIRFRVDRQNASVAADVVIARRGRALSLMSFGQVLGTFDPQLRDTVAKALDQKLQQAQAN